jgi:hypothetical protein
MVLNNSHTARCRRFSVYFKLPISVNDELKTKRWHTSLIVADIDCVRLIVKFRSGNVEELLSSMLSSVLTQIPSYSDTANSVDGIHAMSYGDLGHTLF